MRQNPERRMALIDAAIEVLADQGARGLTFRAVDNQAGVPIGTASNYFPNRDALLTQAGQRVFQRLDPDAAVVGEALALPRTRETVERLMHEMVGRITAFGVIDNLGKGAAGQAVQNLNVMAGLPETEGLL